MHEVNHRAIDKSKAPPVASTSFDIPSAAICAGSATPQPKRIRNWILQIILALALVSQFPSAWLNQASANGDRIVEENNSSYGMGHETRLENLSIIKSKSETVKLGRPYAEALIGDSKIADIIPLSDHSIYILGKSIGSTSLAILDENKQVIEIFQIEVTHDLDSLRTKLRDNLPRSVIKVSSANGGIMLSGTVPDTIALNKAVTIAEQYAPKAVLNVLTVGSSQQVMVEVRFIEASRTASRELGIGTSVRSSSFSSNTGSQARMIGNEILNAGTLLSGGAPFGTLIARLLNNGTSADIIIKALEERGLARRLAEPNLITLSGETASFLAGGEFPFPVAASNDQITIEFKQFGVALAFTPTVLSNGLINLKIVPEVSELDATSAVTIGNIRIPGLVVRRAKTTVELRDGQSFAIAGLLQHTHAKNQAQLPWLGQVPVLGTLFRSAEYQKQETDLVIIVTPRLVQPKPPGGKLATPFDGKIPTADPEFFSTG